LTLPNVGKSHLLQAPIATATASSTNVNTILRMRDPFFAAR
jgi:hypothetical protein